MEQSQLPNRIAGCPVREGSEVWIWKEFQDLIALWGEVVSSRIRSLKTLKGVEIILNYQDRAGLVVTCCALEFFGGILVPSEKEDTSYSVFGPVDSGFAFYRTPQFVAFANRIGFPLEQLVIGVSIRCHEGERLKWTADVAGVDTSLKMIQDVCQQEVQPINQEVTDKGRNPFYRD